MALPIPNVDDRTYEQLLAVLRKQIPTSRWTDHNPSDAGVMLLELLCWLGEMTLYRMNRITDAHIENFLDLVIDPPEPVTVDVSFAPDPPQDGLVIPAGTRLATDFVAGRRFVFETIDDLTLSEQGGAVTGRELLVIADEELGASDGTPNQGFALAPPRRSLGLPEDRPAPVLLDLVRAPRSADLATTAYDPNPRVTVDGVEWQFKPFLRTEDSIGATRHFMVDPFANEVRFGDEKFGMIPPAGAVVRCTYRVLQGTAALLRADALRHVLDPVGLSGADVSHPDAMGGGAVYPTESRLADGLRNQRRNYRVVTEADFEEILLHDFNELEAYTEAAPDIPDAAAVQAAAPTIRRAMARVNRKPPLAGDVEKPGYVTIIVLLESARPVLEDRASSVAEKQAAIAIPGAVGAKIRRFLDDRRLITTRVRLEEPELLAVTLTVEVVVDGERRSLVMEQTVTDVVHGFFAIVSEDPDAPGWPLGRSVYPSELYRVIESIEGVDHIVSLTLAPLDADGKVNVAPNQLPILADLVVGIERASDFGGSS